MTQTVPDISPLMPMHQDPLLVKALFMITPTQQIVCLIVSRQLIADQSPTSCRPVATHFQSVGNQSPTSRRFLGIVVVDQSPIDLQPKKCSFDHTVVAFVAAVFSVARQSPTGCSTCVTKTLPNKTNPKIVNTRCTKTRICLCTTRCDCMKRASKQAVAVTVATLIPNGHTT